VIPTLGSCRYPTISTTAETKEPDLHVEQAELAKRATIDPTCPSERRAKSQKYLSSIGLGNTALHQAVPLSHRQVHLAKDD